MAIFVGTECPKCKNKTVFPHSQLMVIDGEKCAPLTVRCNKCKWMPSEEEIIEQWRKNLGQ